MTDTLSRITPPQFRRLAGGKRRKGREESLNNLIDINEGDMREGMKTYRKYHTEDSVNKLYTPNPVSVYGYNCSFTRSKGSGQF